MNRLAHLLGRRFDRLTVVERASNTLSGRARWRCRCDCGAETIVVGGNLLRGNTRSCGCLLHERLVEDHLRHGLEGTVEYAAVLHARARCRNPRTWNYASYGGRGIEYRLPENPGEAAALLIETLGQRPEGMSIDRIDVDGHYEIGNLRWATSSMQRRNQRRSQAAAA